MTKNVLVFAHRRFVVARDMTSNRFDGFGEVYYQSHCTNTYFSVRNMQAVVSGILVLFCSGTNGTVKQLYI